MNWMDRLFQSICLKPSYLVRQQLLFSYGCTAGITLLLVVITACICMVQFRDIVESRSSQLYQEQNRQRILYNNKCIADTLSVYLENLEGTAQMIAEITKDRIVGYPLAGWETDTYVPFPSMSSAAPPQYPLQSAPLPLDWDYQDSNIIRNNSYSNIKEHIQEERDWLFAQYFPKLSTAHGTYFMQGSCHPSETDPTSATYYPNCTVEHGNVRTGGVLQPTATNYGLYTKSADLAVLLKPFYEAHTEINSLGIFFANEGAGSYVQFPADVRNSSASSYLSYGCDWMREMNPFTNKPIGTETEIARCHKNGTTVPQREYNPLERPFCQYMTRKVIEQHSGDSQQSRNSSASRSMGHVHWFGPFDYFGGGILPVIVVGQALFDRMTGHFIGCAGVSVVLQDMNDFLRNSTNDESEQIAVVRLDGTILTSYTSKDDTATEGKITDRGFISESTFQTLIDCERRKFETNLKRFEDHGHNLVENDVRKHDHEPLDDDVCFTRADNALYTASRLLGARSVLEAHKNFPLEFILLHKTPNRMFEVTTETNEQIEHDLVKMCLVSATVGLCGFLFIIGIVWVVSRLLTDPLIWMEQIAWEIVNHTDKNAKESLQVGVNHDSESISSKNRTKNKCTPTTEITVLVKEFRNMINGFSGDGSSVIAYADVKEIRNELTWQSEFQQLYTAQPRMSLDNTNGNNIVDNEPNGNANIDQQRVILPINPPRHIMSPGDGPIDGNDNSNDTTNLDGTGGRSGGSDIEASGITHSMNEESENIASDRGQTVTNEESAGSNDISDDPLKRLQHNPSPLSHVDDNNDGSDQENIIHVDTLIQATPALKMNSLQETLRKSVVLALPKRNLNKNILSTSREAISKNFIENNIINNTKVPIHRSSLFWWLLVLIVMPILITNAVICSIVWVTVDETFPAWINIVQEKSSSLERGTVESSSKMKAKEAEHVIQKIVRDLHVITRTAGWLLFGGINRSDSFTYMEEIAEYCKTFPDETCPKLEREACPCEWEDVAGAICTDDVQKDSRFIQDIFYFGEARDYNITTGDRYFVAPKQNDSPNQTKWWSNFTEVPGYNASSSGSGFQTTYDRVRVASAMGIIDFPVYNYATKINREKHIITAMISLDADGMSSGYSGCNPQHGLVSQFPSTEGTGAARIAPKLCPLGKYGFDPRCRAWYDSGKQAYLQQNLSVHVTAPYKFALENLTAQSITSPIVNPFDGSYAGQALIDFFPSQIQKILDGASNLSFVITPERKTSINDTVDGPDEDSVWQTASILDLLFSSHDEKSNDYRKKFQENILDKMKNGEEGNATFARPNEQGKVQNFTIFYQPVKARVLLSLRPDDFSRGVDTSSMLVYSLGIAHCVDTISQPWNDIADDIGAEATRLGKVYLFIVVAISFVFMIVAFVNTVSVTRPLVTLLRVVQAINVAKTDDGIPPMQGGSKEVLQVYNSFSKLYKIVRGSNVAFFSGNLVWAYNFINEAIKLFRKVGDEKAIGIACCNLGNTLHAMRHEGVVLTEGLDNAEIAKITLDHYDEAIRIGESQLEVATNENLRADLKQQLSDRLFNRALFVLLLHTEGCDPPDLKDKSIADIKRVRTLDEEVKFFWLDNRMLLEKSSDHFYRLLQRTFGLLEYYEYLNEIWDADEIVREADHFLFVAWSEKNVPLFDDVNRAGRLQQLENVAIQLELRKGRTYEAGRLAMRMFVEDEYLIEEAFKTASIALLSLVREWPEQAKASHIKLLLESDLRKMVKSCRQICLDIRKCAVFAFEVNEMWEGHDLLEQINANCLNFYDNTFLDDDYVGIVAYTTRGDLNVPLGVKCENAGLQRSTLDLATTSTSERVCSAIPYALQMLIDCSATAESDSFIVLVTDGYSWDTSIVKTATQQIEKLNEERYTKIHVIILGLEIEEVAIIAECKHMCNVTGPSKFIEVSSSNNNVDQILDAVRNIVRGGGSVHDAYNQGIIMEMF